MIKVCIFSSKDIYKLIDSAIFGGDENEAAIQLATLTTSSSIKTPCFYCSQLIGLGQNAVCLMPESSRRVGTRHHPVRSVCR